MTNKKKLQEVFPNMIFIGTIMLYKSTEQVLASNINYNWLNAEYEEPKCQWIKYDYRTMCPKEHNVDTPYWRIPDNMNALKYCPYCGKKIEVRL